MSPSVTLDRIPPGRSVRIEDVEGDDPIARRLDDLGLRSGVRISVVRRAPLGDPTVFELCGYQLCLRRSESARVRVASATEGRGDADRPIGEATAGRGDPAGACASL